MFIKRKPIGKESVWQTGAQPLTPTQVQRTVGQEALGGQGGETMCRWPPQGSGGSRQAAFLGGRGAHTCTCARGLTNVLAHARGLQVCRQQPTDAQIDGHFGNDAHVQLRRAGGGGCVHGPSGLAQRGASLQSPPSAEMKNESNSQKRALYHFNKKVKIS